MQNFSRKYVNVWDRLEDLAAEWITVIIIIVIIIIKMNKQFLRFLAGLI
jgi:hypothetical protein